MAEGTRVHAHVVRWLFLAASAAAFLCTALLVHARGGDLDRKLSHLAVHAGRGLQHEGMEQITRLGGVSVLTPVAAVLAVLYLRFGRRWDAAFASAAFAGASCVGLACRLVFHRLNPQRGVGALSVSMPHGLRLAFVLGLAAWVLVGLVVLTAIRRGRRITVPFVAVAIATPLLATSLLHHVVRSTVTNAPGLSFPSSHAFASGALALAVATAAWPTRWRWPVAVACLAAVVAVGITRISLGEHHPTDVVAGWIAAMGWVSAVGLAFPREPATNVELGRREAIAEGRSAR